MLAHAPSVILTDHPTHTFDVLPLLQRVRRALTAALKVPRQPRREEQRYGAVYVGLVDLQMRLQQVHRCCTVQSGAGLRAAHRDLQARATTAVELLEHLTALFQVSTASAEGVAAARAHSRRILALERAYDRALFA